MIRRWEKPLDNLRPIFPTAYEKCQMKKWGYIEEEYFFYGFSNIYGRIQSKKQKTHSLLPYCNRIIIRRPENIEKFSGIVLLELMNASYFIDLDRVWTLTYQQLMRRGDIYVGMTSKPSVLTSLYKVNYKRYGRLSWKNPNKNEIPEKYLGNIPGASSQDTEDGLIWDMITDMAGAIKQGEGPFSQIKRSRIVLGGWSQSGGYIIRYIKDFQDEINEKNGIDGFFSCGSGSISTPDLNQSMGQTAQKSDCRIYITKQPFMELHTESENFSLGNKYSRGKDGDLPDYKYRIYDIPGATHDSIDTITKYYLNDQTVHWTGIVPTYPGKELWPNNYPYQIVFRQAWEHLCRWIAGISAPPKIAPISVDEKTGRNKTDQNGNALGGWRLPQIDYATRTYHPCCTPMKKEYELEASLFGYMTPLDRNVIRSRYKDMCSYEKKIRASAEKYIQRGLLLEEDRECCIQDALTRAYQDGWEE